ncbi:MAG TPA: condensation domain-containing protein, partial [Streptosporangiaceae bacterium]
MLTDAQREALAMRLRRGRGDLAGEIPRRQPGLTDLPLSYGQEQLWFIDRFAPGLPTYNIPHALRITGPLDAAALSRAAAGLVSRHEALRTRLVTGADGRPVQVIDPPGELTLELVDLSGGSAHDRDVALSELIETESVRPFSLEHGPLLRAHLVRLADDEHVLVIVFHHVVFDGWSAGVFLRELAALYGQERDGQPSGLAELPVQFADYALWERDRLSGPLLEELECYWRGVLDGFETIEFPTDRRRGVLDDFGGALAVRMTSQDLLGGLRALARREGTTLFVTLMAGLQALLYRYTGQTDLVVGTASANRGRAELAPMIGFLVNTLPIRADLSGDPPFTEVLARVREATTGAYGHQDLPFARLVETMRVERDPSRPPLFQIGLTYAERDPVPVRAGGAEFTMTDLVVGINAAKIDLSFLAEARREGLWFECTYKTALFDGVSVQRLLGNLEVLLAGVVADPGARVSQLPVLTRAELHRELTEWNDTDADLPVECIHHGFERQAARTPDAVAAQFGDEHLTYAGLSARANQIARRLRAAGAGPESLVGVCMQTGLDRLAALLGVLTAGAGYVPLDAALPAERLSFLLADTAMTLLLADAEGAAAIPAAQPVTVIRLDTEHDQIAALDTTSLTGTGVTPANVAYVIYTSGSTGQPKGVMVEHQQAINFLHGMTSAWNITPASAVLSFAAYTFDVSVMDMFMPLLAGARVVLAPPAVLHSPPRLADLIRTAQITFACLPPAVLTLLTGE